MVDEELDKGGIRQHLSGPTDWSASPSNWTLSLNRTGKKAQSTIYRVKDPLPLCLPLTLNKITPLKLTSCIFYKMQEKEKLNGSTKNQQTKPEHGLPQNHVYSTSQ